ncbi:MAG TPA: 50S ribosomal protein L3 [Terriglobia bacterium]|jgi:large subunit ribosomal protein L3|nr:50S ribosomal protein L3 [Terriglobia bacterium]
MVSAILGKKLGMTQVFDANGDVTPATVLKAGPCIVIQRKTAAKDGYEAAQLGLVEIPGPKRVNGAREGHFKKTGSGANPTRLLREVRLGSDAGEVNVGDKVLVDQFAVDEYVDVIGVSKGRGFAGVHKRHHFGGGGGSHGSMFHRAPGSIGASAFPSRVLKGMLAAGHMGVERVTVRNLQVVKVMLDDNALVVRGAVPGPNGGYVMVRKAKAPRRRPAPVQAPADVKKKK